jgi:hypothetical protein
MSQHDFNIANQTFPSFRADLNDALVAAATMSAGSSAPTTPYAYQLWFDTTDGSWKVRNSGNTAWITTIKTDPSTGAFSSLGIDDNATSTAMTLDASGNVLVGTITGGGTIGTYNGFGALAGGTIFSSATSNRSIFARRSTDGSIIEFRKDGTTVGSIGANSSALTVGTGDTGVVFFDSIDSIAPLNTSTNSGRDAAINLGASFLRFNNLYLSGGVYLGGTGSANHLDDYEIGFFTPSFTLGSGTATGAAYGRYIKVGQLVYVTFYLQITSGSGTIDYITNLPFASENSGSWAGIGSVRETSQTGYQWHPYVIENQNYMLLRRYDNTGAFATNYTWTGSVTYTTP